MDTEEHPYFATGKLPQKPDPETGQPRPPRAPRVAKKEVPTPRDQTVRKHPTEPAEHGPRLEWCQQTTFGAVSNGAFAAAFMVAVGLLFAGPDAVTFWFAWPIYIVTGALVAFTMRQEWLAAGATWFQHKQSWVNTYELVEVKIGAASASQTLKLTDQAGQYTEAKLRDVQENPDLWDLVYNGILHSAVSGKVNVSPGHRKILGLPEPV